MRVCAFIKHSIARQRERQLDVARDFGDSYFNRIP